MVATGATAAHIKRRTGFIVDIVTGSLRVYITPSKTNADDTNNPKSSFMLPL
ncbi:hypothetical protein GCM10027342_17210 [Photobacterium alginatilyticum]